MENTVKSNITKYSGFSLKGLSFLAKSHGPSNLYEQREVWKELFYRYFNEGRQFNLYELLKNEHRYFAITIGMELQQQNIAIPVGHIEDFIKNLLNFITFLDKEILSSNHIQFEWQLHELAGIKDMLERVRESKIKDNNLRQEINLFIDKMNNKRKESLLLLEEQKNKEQVENQYQIVIKEETKALLKQELKHLDIPLSKLKKQDYLNVLDNLNIYYEDEQRKIIRHGLKKFTYETIEKTPWRCFIENLSFQYDKVNMFSILIKAIKSNRYGSSDHKFDINLLLPNGTISDFVAFIENWIKGMKNYHESYYNETFEPIFKALKEHEVVNDYYDNFLLNELKTNKELLTKLTNKTLSDLFSITIQVEEKESRWDDVVLIFNKELNSWEFKSPQKLSSEISYFEIAYNLFNKATESHIGIINYDNTTLKGDGDFQLLIKGNSEAYELSKLIIEFFPSIEIDNNFIKYLNNNSIKRIYQSNSFSNDNDLLRSFIRHKFCRKKISENEIKNLYTNPEVYKFFYNLTSNNMYQGHYQNHESYLYEYLIDAIPLFDLNNESEREFFFNLPINSLQLLKYKNVHNLIPDMIVEKIKKEIPHEFLILDEYFNGTAKTYTDFVYYDGYENSSQLDKLLYNLENIKIGETVTRTGYKEYLYGREVFLTEKEAKTKYIIDYFQNLYKKNKSYI